MPAAGLRISASWADTQPLKGRAALYKKVLTRVRLARVVELNVGVGFIMGLADGNFCGLCLLNLANQIKSLLIGGGVSLLAEVLSGLL